MKALLLFVCLCIGLHSFAQLDKEKISSKKFMQEAITEGLQKTKFSTELAKKIGDDKALYVGKCQICSGVQNAFKAYAATGKETPITNNYKELTDTSLKVRLKALEVLVQNFVQAYYVNNKYSEAQQAAMQTKLANEAKQSKMVANVSYCASCTGSCKKPE